MADHRLAVVIPTWNRAELVCGLARRLRAEQTDQHFDLVIVDDGSDDDTVTSLSASSIPALTLVSAPHEGVSAARNRGVAATDAEWVTFLDTDDEPDPDWVATWHELIDDGVDVVSVGSRRVEPDGTIDLRSPAPGGAAFGDLPLLWLAGTFAIRRSLFEAVGGYSPTFDFSENTDLALRVATRDAVEPVRTRSIPGARLTIRVRPDRYEPHRRLRTAQSILDLHEHRLELQPKLRATYEAMAGVAAHHLGDRRRAIGHLVRAVRSDPLQPRHHVRLLRAAVA